MAPPSKTAVKPKPVAWPADKKEIFERGMEVADMKSMFKRLAGIKEDGDTDADVDPEAKAGYTIGIGLANAAKFPDKKNPQYDKYVPLSLPKRAVMIVRKKLPDSGMRKELLEVPGFQVSSYYYGKVLVESAERNTLILDIPGVDKGLARKLKKAIKGSGCNQIVILENGQKVDPGEEDEQGEGSELQTEGETVPETEDVPTSDSGAPTPPPPPWNPAEVNARLAALVKEFAAAAPTIADRVAELRTMVESARASIKTGVENEAVQSVDAFEKALREAAKTGAPGSNGGMPAGSTIAKSGQAWTATVKKVEDELSKLEQAIVAHYGEQPFVGQLQQLYSSKTKEIVSTLDQTLSSALEQASGAGEPEEQKKLLGEAQKALSDVQNWVVGNELLTQLDDNPFTPLQTKKTLTATVGLLRKSLGVTGA